LTLKLKEDGNFIIAGIGSDASSSAKPVVTFDSFGNATFAGIITADKVKANQIEGLEIITGKITKHLRGVANT